MNVSSTFSVASTPFTGLSQSSAAGQRQRKDEALASALKTLGVDDSKTSEILNQVHDAVDSTKSNTGFRSRDSAATRDAVDAVLLENGVDPAEVRAVIGERTQGPVGGQQGDRPQGAGKPRAGGPRAGGPEAGGPEAGGSRAGGPRAGGPPGGGPPPRGASGSGGSVESALLSSDVDETEVDDLLTQLLDAVSEITASESNSVSSDSIRTALIDVLEKNGVDVGQFEQAIQGQLGERGTFFDQVA